MWSLCAPPPDDGLPTGLADLLLALLERRPEPEGFVLLWNYASIYALEREPLFFDATPWERHPRLHFRTDDTHPLGASHHQKLVVVDGKIAFCGGLDLSKWRWDSDRHLAADPRRLACSSRQGSSRDGSRVWHGWLSRPRAAQA